VLLNYALAMGITPPAGDEARGAGGGRNADARPHMASAASTIPNAARPHAMGNYNTPIGNTLG